MRTVRIFSSDLDSINYQKNMKTIRFGKAKFVMEMFTAFMWK